MSQFAGNVVNHLGDALEEEYDGREDEFTQMVQEREPILQVDEEVISLVNLGDTDYPQMVKIVDGPEKDQLAELCIEYKEIFA